MILWGLYSNLKIVVININPTTLIICKNGPSIINTSSNVKYILYFCETISKNC